MEDMEFEVENCLYCLKKAKIYTGHVLLDHIAIGAGFCAEHQYAQIGFKNCLLFLGDSQGCFGGWLPEYGLKLSPK